MISNSLYIDFIHSDIHGRSCKNDVNWTLAELTLLINLLTLINLINLKF